MTANEFIEKYGISTTFEQLYTIQRKMNRGSNFTFKDSAFIKPVTVCQELFEKIQIKKGVTTKPKSSNNFEC